MTTLNEIISQAQTGDPETTAEAVMDAIELPERLREILRNLFVQECRRQTRQATHIAEKVGISGEQSPLDELGNARITASAFLAERFYNGKTYVTWGEATVQDHLDRIAFLQKKRNGIGETIGRHKWAVDRIESRAVDCLNDISDDITGPGEAA